LVEDLNGPSFKERESAGLVKGDVLIIEQNRSRHFARIGRELAGRRFFHPGRNVFSGKTKERRAYGYNSED